MLSLYQKVFRFYNGTGDFLQNIFTNKYGIKCNPDRTYDTYAAFAGAVVYVLPLY